MAGSRLLRRARMLVAVLVVGSVAFVGSPATAEGEAPTDDPASVEERPSVLPDVPPIVSDDPPPNAGPLSPPNPPDSEQVPPQPVDQARIEAQETGQRVAVEELWTETTAVYAEPSGALTEEIAAGPVRTRSEDEDWVPIDPDLVETEAGVEPAAVPGEVVLSDGGTGPLVDLTEPAEQEADGAVSIDVAGPLPAPTIDGPVATYPDALDGSDLVVTSKNVGVEVSIVIPEASAAQDSYELEVGAEGYEVEQVEGGGLQFSDEDGAVVATQTPPVMFDATASGIPGVAAHPGPVTSRLAERDGRQVLVIEPDPDYLADPATEFPVTIDPLNELLSLTADTSVFASVPTASNDASASLHVGYTGYTGPTRAFLKFGTSSFEDKPVLSASLQLYQDWAGSCTATNLAVRSSGDFPNTGMTWNTQPSAGATNIAQANTTGDTATCPGSVGWKTLDVTSLAQAWSGDAAMTGALTLRANESLQAHAKGFRSRESANPPKLTVSYDVYPSAPTSVTPANGAVVTTLQPTLKATLAAPGFTGQVHGYFKVLDQGQEIDSEVKSVTSGQAAQWSLPEDLLRVGRTYTWELTACTGIGYHSACAATISRTLVVNPGLAAGNRSFFTYDTLEISERAGLAVNVATGNLSLGAIDQSVVGIDSALSFSRTYNSLSRENSTMGHKWSTSYASNVRLVPESDGGFVYYGPTGEAVRIAKDGSTYRPSGDLDARFFDATAYYGVYILEFNHDRGGFKAGDQLMFHRPGSATPSGPDHALWGMRSRNGHSFVIDYQGTSSTILEVTGSTAARDVDHDMVGGRITARTLGSAASARTTTYGYDGNGDLVLVTDAEGHVTEYQYTNHLLTRIISIASPDRYIDITYDALGRVKTITRDGLFADETTEYRYSDLPTSEGYYLTEVEDARDNVTKYYADRSARVRRAYNAVGDQVDTRYDDSSNVIKIDEPGGITYTFGWSQDNRNNLTNVTLPTTASATSTYDPQATTGLDPYRPTGTTDPQGNDTGYQWDSSSNLNRTDLPSGAFASVVRHGIDGGSCPNAATGQVCSARNPRGKTTTFTYDANHDIATIDHPTPLGTWELDHDPTGRVTLIDDGRNIDRTFVYDRLDQLLSASYDATTTIAFEYDPFGNMVERTDPGGAVWSMAYDDANRLDAVSGPPLASPYPADLYDVDFEYDLAGNLESMEDVGGETTYTYDDINMVRTITDPDGNVTTYDYDEPDHGTWLTEVTFPNGAHSAMQYDSSGRIKRLRTWDSAEDLFIDETYSFQQGSTDRTVLQKLTKPGSTTEFTYDGENQLWTMDVTLANGASGGSYEYDYDSSGNRTLAIENGVTRTFSYNDADQLQTTGVVHDGNGNMTEGGAHGFEEVEYNLLDQATVVTPKSAADRTQAYTGQMQSAWLADASNRFAMAGTMGITAIATPSDLTTFVRDPAGRLISMERGSDRHYYHYDGRGSIEALTDEAGVVARIYEYTPYGRLLGPAVGTLEQPFRWNGEYALNDYDYKIGGRWYDASLGRWTQRDPAATDPNSYAFGANDPVNKADPTGLGWTDVLEGAGKWVGRATMVKDVYDLGKAAVEGDEDALKEEAAGIAGGVLVEGVCIAGVAAASGGTLTGAGAAGCTIVSAAASEGFEKWQSSNNED